MALESPRNLVSLGVPPRPFQQTTDPPVAIVVPEKAFALKIAIRVPPYDVGTQPSIEYQLDTTPVGVAVAVIGSHGRRSQITKTRDRW